jgi:tRNA C32,U32 (ribose-2'-O)-methylase TrmJ
MTDDLVKRLREWRNHSQADLSLEAANRIEALTAQLESTLKDRKLILEERDRTFALMLARAETAEADNARLREALTGIKRAAAHRMQNDRRDLHSYYFHTADAAITGKAET